MESGSLAGNAGTPQGLIAYFRRMLRQILLIVFILIGLTGFGQNLSPNASVSLITCGPGNDLYATFGHSALHVNDPVSGVDKVYNYGTFDFNTPNFYMKFARGKLDYYLHVTDFRRFASTYVREGRWVYRQELNLSKEQIVKLYNLLEENAKPENRAYKYDFFYDNCSTRIRDILEKALGNKLKYPQTKAQPDTTFRQLIDIYLETHPWSDLGIDLALGAPCDKVASWREKMFLPDYLMKNMGKSDVLVDGKSLSLIKNENLVLPENPQIINHEKKNIGWLFWGAFVIIGLASIFIRTQALKWFDIILYSAIGILGILILLLWFATDHGATKWNFNILWALPSWLLAPYFLLRSINSNFFKVHAMAMFALVVFWILIPQNLHAVTVPLILILGIRSWTWNKYFFQKAKK